MRRLRLANIVSFYIMMVLVCILLNSANAHNVSWNKAIIKVRGDRLSLKLRVMQEDLLGAVDPGKDSTIVRSLQEWRALLPKIRNYVFENTVLKINDRHVTEGVDGDWGLEEAPLSDHEGAHSHMGVLEISHSWKIVESLKKLEIKLDLLKNVDIPVKWVVLIFPGDTVTRRLYRIVKRGETAYYDFGRYAWVDRKGKPLPSGDEGTLWGRLVQFVKVGFSRISLEEIFKSTENPQVMIIYLLLAIVIGAFHALSPGHGKALIGAYIIGTRGTVADAITLGIVTAASHTVSVLILGVILLTAFGAVVPDDIAAYFNAVSGLVILIIGLYLLRRRFREMRGSAHSHDHHEHSHNDYSHEHSHHIHEHSHSHDTHEHEHEHNHHDHSHGHDHQHVTMESIRKNSLWTNVMMGISGGMVPCPAALVVLFLAISLKKLALGLIVIIFFSFGLAATLTALGILFAKGSKLIDRYDNNRIVVKLPVVSAGIIVILGAVIMIRAMISIV